VDKPKLLVVEDDGILAIHLEDTLTRLGYQVVGLLATGEEAVDLVANGSGPVDLVLMDIELAGPMNGIAAAEKIHGLVDVPVVFLTGFSQDPLLREARIAAPYGYLIKPVPERELAATVEIALHRHSLDRQLRENQLALANSEARYRDLFENSPLGIFRTTLDGRALAVNQEMARIVGCATPEEAIANFSDLAATLYVDPARRREFIATLQERGAVRHFEYEGRKKTGERIWISMNARLNSSELKGDPAGMQVIDGFAMDITERKLAEEKSRESSQRLRLATESGQMGVWDWGVTRDAMFWDQRMFELYGIEPGDFSASVEQWKSRLHPEDRQRAIDECMAALAGEKAFNTTFRIVAPDGAVRYMKADGLVLRDGNGNATRMIGVNRDVSEQHQMLEALRASEEKHRTLLRMLPDIICHFDRQGRHLFASENVSRYFELEPEQMIGRTLDELGFPDDLCRQWNASIREAFDSGRETEMEFVIASRMGKSIFNWRLMPQRDHEGTIRSVLTLARDVTAHRQAERDYRLLFEEMLEGFALHEIIVDDAGVPVDYRFIAVNPAFERLTGLRSADILGRTVLDLMPQTERHWIETYGRVAQSGEPVSFENYSAILRKHYKVTAFRPLEGHFACIISDITDRVLAEQERQKLEAQLRQAQKLEAIGTLAGGIAHDFNNILGAILGYAEMAKEDCQPGSYAARDVEQILQAGNRARELVKQILAFSRQAEIEQVPLQPSSIIREAIKLLRSSFPSTIRIVERVDKDAGPVLADPTQIHQILMNLCTNAFHAMEEKGGTLGIALRRTTMTAADLAEVADAVPGDYVQMAVSDTGPGIVPEIRDRIFDPYFTTKEQGKGTGLGLAIVHGIVTGCGGFITCRSVLGEGSEFAVFLPLHESQAPLPVPGEVQPVAEKGSGERILFVDDEEMLVLMGTSILERFGYTVTAVTSSREALTAFREEPDRYDLVITDQTMPEMTGIELAGEMLKIRPDIPIILCTGYSNLLSEEKVRNAGLRALALKPLTKMELVNLIRRILGQGRE
jgi:PAS domain S-box-containing protein